MATFTYKFVLLKDPDVTSHQSRGLNLQVNGYAPVSDRTGALLTEIEAGRVPDIGSLASSRDITLLFRDLSYTSSGGKAAPSDVGYDQAVKTPGAHMFQGVRAEASDEISYSTEEGATRSQTVLSFDIYDTMMGNRLSGAATIDGVVLYGQAYNVDFYDVTAQGQLENSIPIALILFTGDQKPSIDPASSSKASEKIVIAMSLYSGVDITPEVSGFPEYSAWSKLAGTMSVVNRNLTTSGSFIVRGRRVEAIDDTEFDGADERVPLQDERTIDFPARLFFTNDPDGVNNDHNVDFGSPARLTVMNRESVAEGMTRVPQVMLSKVRYFDDPDDDKLHAFWDGVSESWYATSAKSTGGTPVSGSLYDVDWISDKKPGLSIFSTETDFAAPGIVSNGANFVTFEGGDQFANGTNIQSNGSQALDDGMNVNTKSVKTHGNAMVLNSSDVESYSRSVTDDEYDGDKSKFRYDTFIANSQDLGIYREVLGSDGQEFGNPNSLNTILGTSGFRLDNVGVEDDGISIVIGVRGLDATYVRSTKAIGISKSDLARDEGSTYIGGSVRASCVNNGIVIGTDPEMDNYIEGSSGYQLESPIVLGRNNHLTTKHGDSWIDWQSDVYLVGKGLKNDPRQQNHTETDGRRTPQFILGQNNADYYQKGRTKEVVIGGKRYQSAGYGDFKYNSFEHAVVHEQYGARKGSSGGYWIKESINSLTDVKGRKVDYGSCSIDLNYLSGDRTTASYESYDFKGCGRINLFKLYQLLKRMYWCYDGTVRYDWNQDQGPSDAGRYPVPFRSWDIYGGTVLGNLVDDDFSTYPYFPMK